MILVFLEIGERDFEDSALQSVICVFQTRCFVDQSLPNTDPRLD